MSARAGRAPLAAAAALGALACAVVGTAATRAAAAEPPAVVVDPFDDATAWSARPADGVGMEVSVEGEAADRALRLDFRFSGGGYAVAHREASLDLTGNWAFRFRIRGQGPANHLEFKLIDATGENVWWNVHRDLELPSEWRTITIRKRQVSFAWGPLGGGEPHHVAAIEFAVTAGGGGTGTVWLDDLELVPLPSEGTPLPPVRVTASSSARGRPAAAAVDGTPAAWEPDGWDASPWVALDFGASRELGGLEVEWVPRRHAADYVVERSADGRSWETLRAVRGGNGSRDALLLPETEARHLRLRAERPGTGAPVALREIRVRPPEWGATRERFFESIAAASRRGLYPRGMSGEQAYWTIVGADADPRDGLLGEDGALEAGPRGFSVEPFLLDRGRLVTWADVRSTQALVDGCLPMPSVTWDAGPFTLEVLAFGDASTGGSSLLARYRITNRSAVERDVSLVLAIRPFQVNPPSQFLNLAGGTSPVRSVAHGGRTVSVDGADAVILLAEPDRFGASTFDGGDVVADWLEHGAWPPDASAEDPFAAASAALEFTRRLDPGGTAEVAIVVPLEAGAPRPDPGAGDAWVQARFDAARASWTEATSRVGISLPPSAARVERSLRAQIGWILVNRAGPAIQPGTRAYARSWIRDGALTSSALLRLGHGDAARAFLEWFAPHQYDTGKIPCVVDRRGADPVPEHDSCGEFIFLVAECLRYGGDRDLARTMWPRVRAAVDYLDGLRAASVPAGASPAESAAFHGILPPSISHEGYSAKPMHSYWDDFWAYRGFRDAAWLAGELGETAEQARIGAILDSFRADLAASVACAQRWHGIDFVPGCADLGDFDATSTTIALSPTGAAEMLPREAVERTFVRYWDFFASRRRGAAWTAYTPYEIRNVGAFVHLGWRTRAQEALDWFLDDQRPQEWRQWPEVVWHDARMPRFLGDLPHGWVGSDYTRSVLDMLAFPDDGQEALVVGAGIPAAWLEDGGTSVRGLPTPWGHVSFTLRREGDATVADLEGPMRVPRGGIVLRLPGASGDVVVRELPARIAVGPDPPAAPAR